jgi:hypothetical protein
MSLSEEVMELIPQSEAKETFCDFAEIALDSTMDEGVLKDIPVVGTIMKVGGAVLTIRDRLFIKKLRRFLVSLEDIPNDQREEFLFKRLGDGPARREVGEKLLLIIDKQDDFTKTELIGYVFKKYIEGQISRDDFDLLAHSISNAHMPDIEHLQAFTKGLKLGDDALGSALFAINLAEIKVHVSEAKWDGTATTQIEYILSNLGVKLANIIEEYENKG